MCLLGCIVSDHYEQGLLWIIRFLEDVAQFDDSSSDLKSLISGSAKGSRGSGSRWVTYSPGLSVTVRKLVVSGCRSKDSILAPEISTMTVLPRSSS